MEPLLIVQSLGRRFANADRSSLSPVSQGPVARLRQAFQQRLSWSIRARRDREVRPANQESAGERWPAAEKRFEVEISFRVKTSDIDFAGHVGNRVYLYWLEDLQLQMLHTYFPLETLMQKEGLAPMLLQTHIEYKREITLFDKTVGRMWMKEMGSLKMALQAEIL